MRRDVSAKNSMEEEGVAGAMMEVSFGMGMGKGRGVLGSWE